MDQPAIIFVHIPKAAGTTLHRIIEHNYQLKYTYSAYATPLEPERSVEAFKSLSSARRAQLQMVMGHLPFGLHEHVPGPATYFTLLREPIDRVLSLYYFVQQVHQRQRHDDALTHETTLRQYVESHTRLDTDNLQVRILSGVYYQVDYGSCTRDMLDSAKRNLRDHFAVVGLSEQFDATLLLLRQTFQWRNIYYVRQNVTSDRPAVADLPADTLDVIRSHNLLDIELYEYAKDLFEARLKQTDAAFAQELERFRATNRRLQPVLRIAWFLHRNSIRAQQLAAAQSSNRRFQPLWHLYWLARQYSVRALIRRILASRRDTA